MPNVIDIRTGKVIKEFGYTEDDRDAAEAFASRSEHYRVGDKSLTKFPPIAARQGSDMKREETGSDRAWEQRQSKLAGVNRTVGATSADQRDLQRLGQPRERDMYTQSDPSKPYPRHVQRDIAPDVPGGNPIAGMVNPNPITSVDPATAQRAMQMGAPNVHGSAGNHGTTVGSPILQTQQGPIRRDARPTGQGGAVRRPAPTPEEIQRRLLQLQQQRGGPLGPQG
tara:strand:+ start:1789 stop:2463 length:675 start_codon:yes stop_codon:yes gene_type:complete